ncbi:MAG TPA: hypothetical protein VLJ86_27915 [Ramlibacter sp.]|nr:hypothetical protein [Ramlibacter sp.]
MQVGLDPGASINDLCAEADVFYGDTRIEGRAVELRATPGSGDTGTLRIRSATPIDEPFATVYLRVGCGQKLTRRFVLLTEQPNDVAEAAAQPSPAAPTLLTPSELAPLPAPAAGPSAAGPATGAAAPSASAARAPQAPQAVSRPRSAAVAAQRPEPTPSPRRASPPPRPKPAVTPPKPAVVETPRLRLDPLEARPTASAPKASPTAADTIVASAAPVTPAAPDAGAAATPVLDEATRNAQRMQALEADIKALREGMQKSDAALGEVRGRLERAEGERYANGLVYTLAGLLAAACALAAFLGLRRRPQPPTSGGPGDKWWLGPDRSGPDELHEDDAQPHKSAPGAEPVARIAASTPDAGGKTSAAAMTGLAAAAAAAATAETSQPASVEPAASNTANDAESSGLLGRVAAVATPVRPSPLAVGAPADAPPVKIDELSDLQQQSDFFVSLGEYDRAIDVLKAHVDAHPQASAIAWLDLLDIFHRLGRKAEFEQLRSDFEWLFNATVPGFDAYTSDKAGLEAYPKALSRIQSLWPSARALEVIDDAISRRPGAEDAEAFGLEAYRELLLLHNIAGELAAPEVLDDNAQALPTAPVTRAEGRDTTATLFGATEFEQLPAFLGEPVATTAGELSGLGDLLELPGIDINLDELQTSDALAVEAAGAPGKAAVTPSAAKAAPGDGNLLDFDLDLNANFKLPPAR